MAYEKQTWQTGDVITQEKLNHMEDGIADMGGGDVMVIHAVARDANGTGAFTIENLSAQYDDILAALQANKTIVALVGIAFGSYPPTASVLLSSEIPAVYAQSVGFVSFGGVISFGGYDTDSVELKFGKLYVRADSASFDMKKITLSN